MRSFDERGSSRARAWHEFPHIAFDVDGTLLNSNIAHVWSWQDAIEAESLFFPHLTLFLQMGLPGRQLVEKFAFALRDRETAARIAESAGRLYAERYVNLVSPFHGATRLLRVLKDRGCKLYALTSAGRHETDAMMRRFKLDRYFEIVLTSADSGEGKPTAEPFSALKERIGARARLVSVGDSPFDLKASLAAGVPFVYVGHGGFPREWFTRAHATFFNIAEMLASLRPVRREQRKAA